MEVNTNREYFPVVIRAKLIKNTQQRITVYCPGNILESVYLCAIGATFTNDAGVRISSQETRLYPETGSTSDGSAGVAGFESYGIFPAGGCGALTVAINRKLQGPMNRVDLDFSNWNVTTDLSVNVILNTAIERKSPTRVVEDEKVKAA